jgi:hypothetical protein
MDFNFGENFTPHTASNNDATFRSGEVTTVHDDDSPDLLEVATGIKELRDRASRNSRAYSVRLNEIHADPNLSATGRDAEINAETDGHRAAQKALRERENELIDRKVASLELRLDGIRGYASSDIIAFRDAQDRAEAISTPEDAAKVMARALRTSDRTLAHAVFRVAFDNQWTDAVNQFKAEQPDTARIVTDIGKLKRLRSQFGRGLVYA